MRISIGIDSLPLNLGAVFPDLKLSRERVRKKPGRVGDGASRPLLFISLTPRPEEPGRSTVGRGEGGGRGEI